MREEGPGWHFGLGLGSWARGGAVGRAGDHQYGNGVSCGACEVGDPTSHSGRSGELAL